jgi:hypothetical protein
MATMLLSYHGLPAEMQSALKAQAHNAARNVYMLNATCRCVSASMPSSRISMHVGNDALQSITVVMQAIPVRNAYVDVA